MMRLTKMQYPTWKVETDRYKEIMDNWGISLLIGTGIMRV